MGDARKWARLTFVWAFVALILAWIWAPSVLSFEQRVEINQAVSSELVAMTGLPILANVQLVRFRGNEVALANAEHAHSAALARAERQALNDALIVVELPHIELPRATPSTEAALEVTVPSTGAKFIRVGQ